MKAKEPRRRPYSRPYDDTVFATLAERVAGIEDAVREILDNPIAPDLAHRLHARAALRHLAALRAALAAGDAPEAAQAALQLGAEAELLHAVPWIDEGVAYLERQEKRAHLGRGTPAMQARNEQILKWNDELACYPKGRPRERYERVRLIHEECVKKYRDLRAEAHSLRDKAGEATAAVWNISESTIDGLLPRKTKKNG